MLTARDIQKLWLEIYGEDLAIEYSGFYRQLKRLEQEKKNAE
tara:strand:+ start:241 stop:366 length:126 start_codon:yes stop_codon:yes gene_type:complete